MLRGIFASGGGAPVGGSGTTNYLAKWTGGSTLGNSIVFDDGAGAGIGTTGPTANTLTFGASRYVFWVDSQTKLGDDGIIRGLAATGDTGLSYFASKAFNIRRGNTFVATFDTNGFVGIGTTSPYAKASVRGGANDGIGAWSTSGTTAGSPIGASLFLGDDNFYNSSFYNKAPGLSSVYDAAQGNAAAIAFYSYNGSRVERMRIDSSGNVGIGTASPASKLDVAGTITCDDAGTGLKLPATPGNADTQTLDCYQENTWAPTLAGFGGTAPTVNSASYTRIGRLVYFNIFLVATGGASYSGTRTTTTISLPFQTAGGQALVNMMDANVNALGSGLIATNSGGVIFLPTFALTTTNTFISGWYQV